MINAASTCASGALALSVTLLAAPLAAQERIPIDLGPVEPISADDEDGQPPAPEPDEGRLVIDLMAEPELTPGAQLSYDACTAEQDAARLRGEIIVCRQREDDAAYSGFDREKWERDYARRTQGVKTPNVAGAGGTPIYRALGSMVMVNVSVKLGEAPEQPLLIDVSALPEAAPGSDADRIARGLAPLDDDK
ncbi:MAG: hypothetical protein AAF291_05960 [Pseudomonadota bacterium]